MTEYTQEEKDRLVDAILHGVDDDWDGPPWEQDPIPRHYGWVEGVAACEPAEGSKDCAEHGWVVTP